MLRNYNNINDLNVEIRKDYIEKEKTLDSKKNITLLEEELNNNKNKKNKKTIKIN